MYSRVDFIYARVLLMNRENLAESISVLLALYGPESGYLEYKEGSHEDPGDNFDSAIALGWVTKTDTGGPWRRVEVSPKGIEMVEGIFKLTGVKVAE